MVGSLVGGGRSAARRRWAAAFRARSSRFCWVLPFVAGGGAWSCRAGPGSHFTARCRPGPFRPEWLARLRRRRVARAFAATDGACTALERPRRSHGCGGRRRPRAGGRVAECATAGWSLAQARAFGRRRSFCAAPPPSPRSAGAPARTFGAGVAAARRAVAGARWFRGACWARGAGHVGARQYGPATGRAGRRCAHVVVLRASRAVLVSRRHRAAVRGFSSVRCALRRARPWFAVLGPPACGAPGQWIHWRTGSSGQVGLRRSHDRHLASPRARRRGRVAASALPAPCRFFSPALAGARPRGCAAGCPSPPVHRSAWPAPGAPRPRLSGGRSRCARSAGAGSRRPAVAAGGGARALVAVVRFAPAVRRSQAARARAPCDSARFPAPPLSARPRPVRRASASSRRACSALCSSLLLSGAPLHGLGLGPPRPRAGAYISVLQYICELLSVMSRSREGTTRSRVSKSQAYSVKRQIGRGGFGLHSIAAPVENLFMIVRGANETEVKT